MLTSEKLISTPDREKTSFLAPLIEDRKAGRQISEIRRIPRPQILMPGAKF
jgi:hypothetical protein